MHGAGWRCLAVGCAWCAGRAFIDVLKRKASAIEWRISDKPAFVEPSIRPWNSGGCSTKEIIRAHNRGAGAGMSKRLFKSSSRNIAKQCACCMVGLKLAFTQQTLQTANRTNQQARPFALLATSSQTPSLPSTRKAVIKIKSDAHDTLIFIYLRCQHLV